MQKALPPTMLLEDVEVLQAEPGLLLCPLDEVQRRQAWFPLVASALPWLLPHKGSMLATVGSHAKCQHPNTGQGLAAEPPTHAVRRFAVRAHESIGSHPILNPD